jgi:hypothetical protein
MVTSCCPIHIRGDAIMTETLAGLANEAERKQGHLDARSRDIARRDEADPEELSFFQNLFNEAFVAVGLAGAPAPQQFESLGTYRRRLLGDLQQYCASPGARETNLWEIPAGPPLDTLEKKIITEVMAAAEDRTQGDFQNPEELREVTRVDSSGRKTTEWAGPSPLPWMSEFMYPEQFVTRFNTGNPIWTAPNRSTLPNRRTG